MNEWCACVFTPPPVVPQAANATFDTLTLARFICESSLQVYKFVSVKASLLAAAAMYLALRMKNLGGWVSDKEAAQQVVPLEGGLDFTGMYSHETNSNTCPPPPPPPLRRLPPCSTTLDVMLKTCYHWQSR